MPHKKGCYDIFYLVSEYGYGLAYVLTDDQEFSLFPEIEHGNLLKRFMLSANMLASGTYWLVFDVDNALVNRVINDKGEFVFSLENISGMVRHYPLPEEIGSASLYRPTWGGVCEKIQY